MPPEDGSVPVAGRAAPYSKYHIPEPCQDSAEEFYGGYSPGTGGKVPSPLANRKLPREACGAIFRPIAASNPSKSGLALCSRSGSDSISSSAFPAAPPASDGEPAGAEAFARVLSCNMLHLCGGGVAAFSLAGSSCSILSQPAGAGPAVPRNGSLLNKLSRHMSSASLRSLASATLQYETSSSASMSVQRNGSLLQATFEKRASSSTASTVSLAAAVAAASGTGGPPGAASGGGSSSSSAAAAAASTSAATAQQFAQLFVRALATQNVKWASEEALSSLFDAEAKLKTLDQQLFVGRAAILRRLNGGMEQLSKMVRASLSDKQLEALGDLNECVSFEVGAPDAEHPSRVVVSYAFKVGRTIRMQDHFKIRGGRILRLKRMRC